MWCTLAWSRGHANRVSASSLSLDLNLLRYLLLLVLKHLSDLLALVLIPLKNNIKQVVGDHRLLHLLVLQKEVFQWIEGFPKWFYYFMCQETIFGCIILIVQRIQYDKISLGRAMFKEWATIWDIDSEQRHIKVVTVVVKESHQQSSWCQSSTHLQVPFIHVCHKKDNCWIRRKTTYKKLVKIVLTYHDMESWVPFSRGTAWALWIPPWGTCNFQHSSWWACSLLNPSGFYSPSRLSP